MDEASRLIQKLSNAVTRYRNEQLKELDLTAAQADCLNYVLEEGSVSVGQIRTALAVKHSTVHGLVDRLAAKGFLCTKQSNSDRRVQIISATEKGLAMGEEIWKHALHMTQHLLHGMTLEEQNQFLRLLEQANENMKSNG